MPMFFHVTEHATILFEKWHTMTWQELLGSCLGIAVFAMLYEGLKVLRDWLQYKSHKERKARQANNRIVPNGMPAMEDKTGASYNVIVGESNPSQSPFDRYHLLQTLLHLLQVFVGYCLMLVVMTYNAYLVIAVCLGFAIGYLAFAWMKFGEDKFSDCCN